MNRVLNIFFLVLVVGLVFADISNQAQSQYSTKLNSSAEDIRKSYQTYVSQLGNRSDQIGASNLLSIVCTELGGKLEIITDENGSRYRKCILPDGSTCEEWRISKGECNISNEMAARIRERIQEIIRNQSQFRNESGFGTPLTVQEREELKIRVKSKIQTINDSLAEEIRQVKAEVRTVHENQNRVRLAVHALLEMENLTGGIGKNVSAIAREFNNSVKSTIRAEERIQTRNVVLKFLFGGDENAAAEIENATRQNSEKIQNLKQLANKCDCDEETRAMIQQQIQTMEQEQQRLQQIAQKEKKEKGLLGWIFK
ncbi:MAG: DUF333 domain-containing protein [Candidatus Micrarchaeota archaeon]|nr:DUF333 domain-containing protein [Candidatus Micrarchaeota archaeon]